MAKIDNDLYSVLGVARDASADEIKKKFKVLSLKYHPDRQANKSEQEQKEAEQKFKDINEAYQVLSDPEKRKNYDATGDPDNGGFGGFGGMDMNDIFGTMSGHFGGFGGRGRQRVYQPGQNIQMQIPLTIEDVFNGCTKKVKFERNVRCPNCHGAGGTGKTTCPHCHGTGMETKVRRTGFGIMQESHPCPHCNSSGYVVEKQCISCHGSGFKKVSNTVQIQFPTGIEDGQGFQYAGEGNEAKDPKGQNGSFIAVAKYNFDTERYHVMGVNVSEEIYVDYYDLLLGCDYTLKLPNGKSKKVVISPCPDEGKIIKLAGEGIRHPRGVGDYYVIIHYRYPKSLNAVEKQAIKTIKDSKK